MQHSLQSMIGFVIRGTDGDLGKVDEFFFDDETWVIRYMVAETGTWLSGRKVLISFPALAMPDWENRLFRVNLTCEQVRSSPDIDTKKPVYRQHEDQLHDYYQWEKYWDNAYAGLYGKPPYPPIEAKVEPKIETPIPSDVVHLRSSREVIGYHIHASNGEIGHVEDFVIDDESWAVCYMIVDTKNWMPGKKVLVPLPWITSVNWENQSVLVDRLLESVKNSPEYDPSKAIQRDDPGYL